MTALIAVPSLIVLLGSGIANAGIGSSSAPPAASPPTRGAGSYLLTASSFSGSYAPTYTGNGYLGIRVPASGQGYAAGTVPAQAELAGFYAQPPGDVQQRANLPTWSTLTFSDGGKTFAIGTGTITNWRQQLDLHSGVITTTADWTAPNGHRTGLRYDVFTDRAREHVGAVRLQLTPHWSGTAGVTDLIDGTPATLTKPVSSGRSTSTDTIWEQVRTVGTGITAGLASHLRISGAGASVAPVAAPGSQSVGQRVSLPVTAGHTYSVTKYVGVTSSQDAADPATAARQASNSAAAKGFAGLLSENTGAWSALWRGRIDVLGNSALATEVNASEFYLWSSTRAGVDWNVSPAGLSSNGYDGHIFWDAETWMYPSLLAQHPDIAAGMNNYRFQRLGAARQHATATGNTGARYPWESALDGTEQIPPPVSVNSEGLFEQHITADIALAQWQYYLATGDRGWLASRGWPVISQAAKFWASRVTADGSGHYHLNAITGPDEENPDVNDEAFTNVGAATTLRLATQAAHVVGAAAPASWLQIANGLVVPTDPATQTHPEFAGYGAQLVKQADVTMLQYPWQQPMPSAVAQHDVDYYVPRSDPGGPSMTDAISQIDTAALGTPGCASYVYTQRSIEPFIRDAFDQFSETRTGGAFTFTTGIGGFLQEFLYGYSGMRWNGSTVQLDPSLTAQLGGVVLRDLHWHGSTFTVSIGQHSTSVMLTDGPALPVTVAGKTTIVTRGHAATIPTRRPDLTPTNDVVRCRPATSSSAQSGADALAAVDGSTSTDWQPAALPAELTVPLGAAHTVHSATLDWGRVFPPAPAPNVPPPPGPVTVLRGVDYTIAASVDGHNWHTVATVHKTSGTHDAVTFPSTTARYLRVTITTASSGGMPMLEEFMA
ncbi:MAG TPA: discoidin domain-containing protein [Frankiaceae bacterium]|nr:discoidin domain-containing protein [Frankiaceae bacterium]